MDDDCGWDDEDGLSEDQTEQGPERLPVVIVDDEEPVARSWALQLGMDGWQVSTYLSVESALRALVRRQDPFVLVLDHDMQDSKGRFGFDIAARLRRAHPFGLLLPILYHSGRVRQDEYADNERERQSFAPTAWVRKGDGGNPLPDMVARLCEGYWEAVEAQAEQQLRRAIGHVPDDGDVSSPSAGRTTRAAL